MATTAHVTTSSEHKERVETNGFHEEPESNQFVHRVSHLPMVALTLARLSEAYQRTKLRNAILRLALEKGEEAAWTSLGLAQAIANKTGLQGPLNVADSSACYLLGKVEEKLPIITYTPGEIIDSTKRIYDDTLRAQIDRLTHLKENTVQKYMGAKQYGTNKLTEAKHLGATTVKTVMDVPVNRVNQSVEWSLNTVDSLVDKLLPEGDLHYSGNMHYHHDNSMIYDGNLDHAKLVSLKLRQRLMTRLADNTQAAHLLAQALQTVDSLKQSPAAHSLQHVMDNLHRLSDATKERLPGGELNVGNMDQAALHLVKILSGELKDRLEASSQQLARFLPQPVSERLHQATEMAKEMYQQVSQARHVDELPQSLVGQVHTYVSSLQATMNAALDTLTETYLLKWLVPEYKNIGSLDLHIQ